MSLEHASRMDLCRFGHRWIMYSKPLVTITLLRFWATNSRQWRLSSVAWFSSASVSVVAAFAMSTVSHRCFSQMARRRGSSNRSAAASRCCAMVTSRLSPETSAGSASVYTKCRRIWNAGALTSWMWMVFSFPSLMSLSRRALKTGEREATISRCAGISSPSTTNLKSLPSPVRSSSPRSSLSLGSGISTVGRATSWSLRQKAPPDITTSSILYLILMVSFSRYPESGFSSSERLMNLRYPWQLRAFGSCRAQLIFTAPCSLLRPFVMSRPRPDWSTSVKW
mmetsp:Transcript_31326/g.67510  ORF Transcript_31326/g.67510 Transcript_31326/m.67510 type:complete len:281 (+) Transcript_31326:809-1651(+)